MLVILLKKIVKKTKKKNHLPYKETDFFRNLKLESIHAIIHQLQTFWISSSSLSFGRNPRLENQTRFRIKKNHNTTITINEAEADQQ